MHKKNLNTFDGDKESDLEILSDEDIERENRYSKIISLYSKGLNQDEIATQLGVNQSTISRDLQLIKSQTRIQLNKYFRNDILFEFISYLSSSNEVIKELWEIVNTSYDEPKPKINALKLLMQAYEKRHQRVVGGPDTYLKMKKTACDLEYQDFVESDPAAKAMAQFEKLDPNGALFGVRNSLNKNLK